MELLKNLSKQYTLETLPVIIVYTNAVFKDEIEKAKFFVKDILKLDNEFIDVLALEKKIDEKVIKEKNLDVLREKSIKLAKSAVKSSIFEGLISEISEKIKITIYCFTESLKSQINKEVKNFIEKMDENIEFLAIKEKTKTIILNVFYRYFVLTPDDKIKFDEKGVIKCGDVEFSFSEKSMEYLDSFIVDYFQEILNCYENNLMNFLSKYSKELANDISIFTVQFNSKNEGLLNDFPTNIEMDVILKKELKEKLIKKAELAALKNAFIFIVEPLINKIGEYFIEIYKQGITQKKFIEYARDSVKVSFNEIEEKIKKYNEKEKEKEKENKKNLENNNDAAPLKSESVSSISAVTKDVNDMFDDDNDDKVI